MWTARPDGALDYVSKSALSYFGMQPPSEVGTIVSRVGTFIYFAFFLLMPYSKMVHGFFRLAALVADAAKQDRAQDKA